MDLTRRAFLHSATLAAAGLAARQSPGFAQPALPASLRDRYPHVRRHFAFEYYPWYRNDPWEHWPEGGHHPPADFGSNYLPALGLYDSRSSAVLEQHARWIAEAGVGAIDVSWWGIDSHEDQVIPTLMDVMADHDIRVTFNIEPYARDHARHYARDLLYLIRNYGDHRSWDCFLLLDRADGSTGPVFKSFRTILLPTTTDCHGVTRPVADYTPDEVWRRQTDAIRTLMRDDFDHLTLLADSSQVARTRAAGFDGIALFDNYEAPDIWPHHASNCTGRDLMFSFQINPGFDSIVFPHPEPNTCYVAPAFAPGGGVYDWTQAADRAAAEALSRGRIEKSFEATVGLQTRKELTNARVGFFFVYINSFNEWHEGHQFEPARNRAELTPAQRALGYHNAEHGDYRLQTLRRLIENVIAA